LAARVLYFRASRAVKQGDFTAARRDLTQALDDMSSQSREREDLWRLVAIAVVAELTGKCGYVYTDPA
jgi:hypothetical protein